MQVLDAAFPHWTIAQLQAARLGVMRYVGSAGNPKNITSGEFRAYVAGGVPFGLVYESSGADYVGGTAAGRVAGFAARTPARAFGFPDSRPLFTTIDRGVHWADVIGDYQRAFNIAAAGGAPQGFYGDAEIGDRLLALGLIRWYWQAGARAWPGDAIDDPRACLVQRVAKTYPQFPASSYDVNDVFATDWGQYPAPKLTPPKPPKPPTGTTTHYEDPHMPNATDIRIDRLDEHGNGHVELKPPLVPELLTSARVKGLTHLAVRPPESAGTYDPIPRLSCTIAPDKAAEIVIEGGSPNGVCTFRVTWV